MDFDFMCIFIIIKLKCICWLFVHFTNLINAWSMERITLFYEKFLAFLQPTVNLFSIEMKVHICINTTTVHLP
jgi:hypothetical protein